MILIFNVTGTKHLKEKVNVNGLNSWQNVATLDKMCLRSEDDREGQSARAVRPGKENLSKMYDDLPLPLLPLPVKQMTGKECAQWLRSQIIRDQSESYGVTQRQVD